MPTASAAGLDGTVTSGPGAVPPVGDVNETDPVSLIRTLAGDELSAITADRVSDNRPSVTATGDGYLTVWGRQPPDEPRDAGWEVYASTYDGTGWSAPSPVTDNARYDLFPSVAYDASRDRGVVAWVQVDEDVRGEGLNFSDLSSLEVLYATYDGESWSAPRRLTDDDQVDLGPSVVERNGQFLIVWQSPREGSSQSRARLEYVTVADGTASESSAVEVPSQRWAVGPGVDRPFRIAHHAPDDGSVVVLGGADGFEEVARYPAEDPRKLAVDRGGVAWTATEGTDEYIRYASNGSVRRVPTNVDSSSFADLALTTSGNATLLTYRGLTAGTNSPRLIYVLRRNGRWIYEHQLNRTANDPLKFRATSVAAGPNSFAAVFTGREIGNRDQNEDLFALVHPYRPDLRVEASVAENASAGDEVTVSYTVQNVGDVPMESGFNVDLIADGTSVGSQAFPALGVNETVEGTFTATVPVSGRLTVRADPAGVVPEVATGNNESTVVLARPDVGIVNGSATLRGSSVVVEATLRNVGGAASRETNVTVSDRGVVFGSEVVGGLAPGERTDVRFEVPVERAREATGLLVRAVTPGDQNVLNDGQPVAALSPNLGVFGREVTFTPVPENRTVSAEVLVVNRGTAGAEFELLVRLQNGTVLVSENASIGPPRDGSVSSTILTVSLPAAASGKQVEVVVDAPLDGETEDNSALVEVPSLPDVDRRPPTVESFTANATGNGTVGLRLATDEPIDVDAVRIRVEGPDGPRTVSGNFRRQGDALSYVGSVSVGAAGDYQFSVAAAPDPAGNNVSGSPPTASASVESAPGGTEDGDGGGLPTTLIAVVVVVLLAVVGVGAYVVWRR